MVKDHTVIVDSYIRPQWVWIKDGLTLDMNMYIIEFL